MNIIEMIKAIRSYRPGTGLKAAREAAVQSDGTIESALDILDKNQAQFEANRGHTCRIGRIFSYLHNGGQVAVLLELRAETDFVTQNEIFEQLGKELCLQAAATEELSETAIMPWFLDSPHIKNESVTVKQLINTASAKLGENIEIGRICRWDVRRQG